ncbi:hypothetical protein [Methanosphaera stadtmanae]|uniref:hypothetical protein n=2 Tax=Methanosphaera stadtmanae TaxID=2317 RepID=UPI0026666949|nr:hypothetical protein [Methanosphaera stadtmanae]
MHAFNEEKKFLSLFFLASTYLTITKTNVMIHMNTLQLSDNKQLSYDNKIMLEYCIKITRTEYTSKIRDKCYSKCKIKVPKELRKVLAKENYLFFSSMDENVHITVTEPSVVVHKAKIQKYCHNKRVEYSLNLSKKVFNLEDGDYFYWKIHLEDNTLINSVAEIVDKNMINE